MSTPADETSKKVSITAEELRQQIEEDEKKIAEWIERAGMLKGRLKIADESAYQKLMNAPGYKLRNQKITGQSAVYQQHKETKLLAEQTREELLATKGFQQSVLQALEHEHTFIKEYMDDLSNNKAIEKCLAEFQVYAADYGGIERLYSSLGNKFDGLQSHTVAQKGIYTRKKDESFIIGEPAQLYRTALEIETTAIKCYLLKNEIDTLKQTVKTKLSGETKFDKEYVEFDKLLTDAPKTITLERVQELHQLASNYKEDLPKIAALVETTEIQALEQEIATLLQSKSEEIKELEKMSRYAAIKMNVERARPAEGVTDTAKLADYKEELNLQLQAIKNFLLQKENAQEPEKTEQKTKTDPLTASVEKPSDFQGMPLLQDSETEVNAALALEATQNAEAQAEQINKGSTRFSAFIYAVASGINTIGNWISHSRIGNAIDSAFRVIDKGISDLTAAWSRLISGSSNPPGATPDNKSIQEVSPELKEQVAATTESLVELAERNKSNTTEPDSTPPALTTSFDTVPNPSSVDSPTTPEITRTNTPQPPPTN